jgi:hypothetical protein
MAYEEEIGSFKELSREIEILDSDAGIRIETVYKGEDSYVFITRSGQGFALAIYYASREKKIPLPGKRILFRVYPDSSSLTVFLRELLNSPFRSFRY